MRDLSAAFNTIDHDIFLNRPFTKVGIQVTVLDWLKSYLDGRHQSVQVSGTVSAPRHLTFGFPEGSHTGIPVSLTTLMKSPKLQKNMAYLYADDTQLYAPFLLNENSAEETGHIMADCIGDAKKTDVSKQAQIK